MRPWLAPRGNFEILDPLDCRKMPSPASILEVAKDRCSLNFAKSSEIHVYRGLFFGKVLGFQAATLLKTRRIYRCFPLNFAKFFRAPFLQNTSRRLLLSASSILLKPNKEAIKTCSMIWNARSSNLWYIIWNYLIIYQNSWNNPMKEFLLGKVADLNLKVL